MSSSRQLVRGVVITPEVGRIVQGKEHIATRYIVYGDRARNIVLMDVVLDGLKKNSYTYYNDFLYDDQILFFTTNMKFSDDTWSGESPLTRVVLRKEQESSSGIIVTPNVSVEIMNGYNTKIIVSDFIRYDGLSGHDSTSYLIVDDITGDIIYDIPNSRDFLYNINIPSGLLKPNRVYRISARFKDNVGKYSNYGSVIYNYGNILDNIISSNHIDINYGSRTILTNINLDVLVSNKLTVTLYDVDDSILGYPEYRNGSIYFDTTILDIGSKVICEFKYGSFSKYVDLYITKVNTKINKDNDFKFGYTSTPATIISNLNIQNKKLQIFRDGYIYSIVGNALVRGLYNNDDSIININNTIAYYSEFNNNTSNTYRVFENPINGDIIVYENRFNNGVNDYIYIIDRDEFKILKILTIPTLKNEFIDTGDLIIGNDKLYLFTVSDSINYHKLCYTMSLVEYVITLEGTIIFTGSVDSTNYRPILYKNSIYFISKVLTGTIVFKLNIVDLTLLEINNITTTINIPNHSSNMLLATLNTDRITLILPNYSDRTQIGYYDVDIESGIMVEHIYTATNDDSLNMMISDGRGVFLFHDGVNCQKFS